MNKGNCGLHFHMSFRKKPIDPKNIIYVIEVDNNE